MCFLNYIEADYILKVFINIFLMLFLVPFIIVIIYINL